MAGDFVEKKKKTPPHKLQVAHLHLIPYEECRSIHGYNTKESIQTEMICADSIGKERDACYVSTFSLFT